MLRDSAQHWLKVNVRFPRTRSDFLKGFDAAVAHGRNMSCGLGAGLTVNRRPYLIHCFDGELFFFELSARQAEPLGLEGNSLTIAQGQGSHAKPSEPGASLGTCELTAEAAADGRLLRIAGAIEVLGTRDVLPEYAVEIALVPGIDPHWITAWNYPTMAPDAHVKLHVRYEAGESDDETTSPVTVFVRLSTRPRRVSPTGRTRHPGMGAPWGGAGPGPSVPAPEVLDRSVMTLPLSNVVGVVVDF